MNDLSRTALRTSAVTMAANLLLSLGKLAAGLLAHSAAMISDAVHSASDVFSTLIVIVGVRLSGRAADREHPYGHERMECVAAIVLAFILFMTGLFIGWGGLRIVLRSDASALEVPGLAALIAAIVSILVKEGMFQYTRRQEIGGAHV